MTFDQHYSSIYSPSFLAHFGMGELWNEVCTVHVKHLYVLELDSSKCLHNAWPFAQDAFSNMYCYLCMTSYFLLHPCLLKVIHNVSPDIFMWILHVHMRVHTWTDEELSKCIVLNRRASLQLTQEVRVWAASFSSCQLVVSPVSFYSIYIVDSKSCVKHETNKMGACETSLHVCFILYVQINSRTNYFDSFQWLAVYFDFQSALCHLLHLQKTLRAMWALLHLHIWIQLMQTFLWAFALIILKVIFSSCSEDFNPGLSIWEALVCIRWFL